MISAIDLVQNYLDPQWMRRDLIVALYLFFFAVLGLLLSPSYLLAVIGLDWSITNWNANS